jgi:REP element-mobilizing transposase RayT
MIKACEKFDFNLITYVILSNHYHLLIETQDKTNLNKAIQIINGGSAFLIDKPSQTKQVWQRANKNSSAILNEESFFSVLGYIVGNPLKHGIVKDFDELNEYRFCNYIEQINEHSKGLINDLILKNCKLDFESPESFERIYGSA